jgi:hypothetical protein
MYGRRGWFAGMIVVAVGLGLAVRPAETQAGGKAGDAITITLKKEFIETYRNRVTIDVDMTVDAVGKIHSAKKDGEVHFAGRSEKVGLPIVAELMNAKFQPFAMKAIRKAEGEAPIKIKGAWRFWCEHADGSNQKQGMKLPDPFPNSNPAHVFEIHPVTHVGDMDVSDSVGPIEGFSYKKPEQAFTHYENVACKITDNGDTVTIRTNMAGYNIPEFILESIDDEVGGIEFKDKDGKSDGRFMFASVRDTDGELLVRKVRMAFIKGTEAEKAAKVLPKGGRLHVVGIPRISLTLVKFRIDNADDPREPLTWTLPYEIIVVGVIGDDD